MAISVIIPTKGEVPSQLSELLAVLVREEEVLEVIIVDADPEARLACLLEQKVSYIQSSIACRSFQMNLGASFACGEIFWFLHADSRLNQDVLLGLLGALKRGETFGAFALAADSAGWRYRLWEKLVALRNSIFNLVYGDQGMFCTRGLFHAVRGFPNELVFEDLGLWRALCQRQRAKPKLIQAEIWTSMRRFEKGGFWWVSFVHIVLVLLFFLKVHPSSLASIRRRFT